MNRQTLVRAFHASVRRDKKFYDVVVPRQEAAKPIPFPSSVSVSVHRISPSAFPPLCPHGRFSYQELSEHKEGLRKFRESSVYFHQLAQDTAVAQVTGPLGTTYVPIPEWLDLGVTLGDPKAQPQDFWHGQGTDGGVLDASSRVLSLTSLVPPAKEPDTERYLHVSCVDPEHLLQSRHWGFYRRRLATAITALTEGFSVSLRLVGVGYRAQMEPLNLKGPEKSDARLFENWIRRWSHHVDKIPMRKYLAESYSDSLWARILEQRQWLDHGVNRNFRIVEQNLKPEKPVAPQKLVVKLGFTHDVELVVPPWIQVATPNPARIVLSGTEVKQIQEFAGEIRKWRTPEPYKGKGVFVGDETITLKQKRIK